MDDFKKIIHANNYSKDMIIRMLDCNTKEHELLIKKAEEVRLQTIGNEVHGRSLIELSNICKKDCFYCGIRKSNIKIERYFLDFKDVTKAIDLAIESKIGSLAIQSGEQTSKYFIDFISKALNYAKSKDPNIGITLSCGEQKKEVYQKWFNEGAERYLLRIETSNEELYYNYHPKNETHSFKNRLKCLQDIQDIGYQTGTGIMIGLPNQKIENIADDIIFMRDFNIDMCGMGPFIPCNGTPMENAKPLFNNVFEMSLRVIAIMRIIMKDINIVASTAMETIDNNGRKFAIIAGANVMMPNINPITHRKKYSLYNKKPTMEITTAEEVISSCVKSIPDGYILSLNKKGNSLHYKN